MKTIFVFLLLALSACSSSKKTTEISNPEFPFSPIRLWQVKVWWEPYLLDEKKAIIHKEYHLTWKTSDGVISFEKNLKQFKNEQSYLNFFESSLISIGNWDRTEIRKIARKKDEVSVVIMTSSIRELVKGEKISFFFYDLPDPLLRTLEEGCASFETKRLIGNYPDVGFELILESRSKDPLYVPWDEKSAKLSDTRFFWKTWSEKKGNQILYRAYFKIDGRYNTCPPPPELVHEIDAFRSEIKKQAGVQW